MAESRPTLQGTANLILAALGRDAFERFSSEFELVALAIKGELIEPGRPVEHVYFPVSGIHSVVALMANGANVEAGVIGADGIVGASEVLAGVVPANRCFTQVEGEAVRVSAVAFLDEFARGGDLQRAVLRWTQAHIVQISQTAACNRLHSVEQRLARWLLMCHDRAGSDELSLTQEFLSIMLATPRPAITKAVGQLTAPGYIAHTRGSIVVADRRGLEGAACECYDIVREAFTASA